MVQLEIFFTINRKEYCVNAKSVPVDTSLNTFIRNHAHLSGTKFMCLEGGCGACVVNLSGVHPVTGDVFSYAVNSCLFPVLACHGMDVTTVEGIGDKQNGYHPTQKILAHFNGTQCGYCSPGMVMNMYSLLEAKKGKVTMEEIENSFGGNICRCTGYRPILDAFKALAADADPKLKAKCQDIEDLTKICPKTGSACAGKCSAAGKINQKKGLHLNFDENREWHKVYNVSDIFAIFESIGDRPYTLVGGNTAHGVYRRNDGIQVFIDINAVQELRANSVGGSLTVGAGTSLTELMELLGTTAKQNNQFGYLDHLIKHIDLIANVPVRNTGTIAGNLSIKNQHNEFPSDLYLILEAADAKLTILGAHGKTSTVRPSEYATLNMNKKVLLNVILPPLDPSVYIYRTFKIMPRAQNAHAYVNGAFLLKLNGSSIVSSNICFGGINPQFTHAAKTEAFLVGKNLLTNDTVQGALNALKDELNPDWVLPDASPEYRKNLALSLFYKFVLNIAPTLKAPVKAEYQSGGTVLERPLSSGTQSFDTNKENWPLNKDIPKIEGMLQTSGEAKYANDLPVFPNELYAAFVLSTEAQAKIVKIDPSEALKIPGVVGFYSAKDIPGENNFMNFKGFMGPHDEEIFCSEKALYHGQPLGLVVADTFNLANRASKLVKVDYEKTNTVRYPTVRAVLRDNVTERLHDMPYSTLGDAFEAAPVGPVKVKGSFEIGGQYHYTMETQTSVCIPIEDGMDVYSATQWIDFTQIAISKMLKVPENSLNLYVRRLGGGYGSKGTRATLVACAAALAAHKTQRPVRLVMTLEANMEAIGKRYGVFSNYEVDVEKNGKITKLFNEYVHDFGSCLNESMGHCAEFFRNCYDNSAWKTVAKAAVTDAASNTWCRAPGTTEGIAMVETIMEHVAHATGLDPLDVRMVNMPEDLKMRELMPQFRADVEYDARRKQVDEFNRANRWRKRGIAITPMRYPLGYFGSIHALVSVYHTDGSVVITHGGIEMGQGMNTKVAQVAAYILGIPMEKISIKPSANMTSPNAICTGGSMTSETVSFAVKKACEILLERMKPIREAMKDASWETIVENSYYKNVDLCATYMYKAEDLQAYIIWGLTCTELEIDVLTGNVQLLRVDILEDTGESLSPGIDIGQVEGAFIMGVGYYLTEALIFDPETGALLTNRTWTYKPPGAKDIPVDFRIRFLQKSTNAAGVLRSKATGEPAMNMTISVLCALRNAVLAARKDAGLPNEWVPLGAPSTPDQVYLTAGNAVEQYLLN
ncbi:xanthine dehydrogenase/oxidase-like isoform X1 [Anopheles ziemanni]|uniref:xanthine dehydrogenase/oxidase-like isoform X1 n=1 Tax=Anopheles coustani TaxID=139045 RepID=UPI00265A4518|nr:xanthine dehydrogenase/oxidase-like isoform X1 [Anopheles coustani]XP_058178857.1 xanthine dehydrogenase/oxidase-like isoform X1 [Anopheles ziemanni]